MKKLNKADTNEKYSTCLSKILIEKCLLKTGNLCPSQVISTTTFKAQVKKKVFHIFQKVNCKSDYVFYLMECTLCSKEYIGKPETDFDIRLNKHGKDVEGPDEILASKHF